MKKSKKIGIALLAVIVALIICIICLLFKDKIKNHSFVFTESSLNDFNTLNLEYANDEIDTLSYLKNSNNAFAKPSKISLSSIGETEVTYTIDEEEFTCTFIVNDTQTPLITFASDSVDVDTMEGFDFSSNIVSVCDPLDGDLPKVDEEPAKFTSSTDGRIYETGWYTVSVNENTVTVNAYDNHGNTTTKSYTVNVQNQESDEEDNQMYSYQLIDLSGVDDDSNWTLIDSSDWYYSACTYMSPKYNDVHEALNDVVAHEAENGNTDDVESNARIFCIKDAEGKVLYYQAGYEE